MTATTEDSAKATAAPRVRWWLLALGVVPFVGTALLTGRLIWEQTVWTWERGPQMVGFSLAHGSYAVLLMAPFLLALWGAVVLLLIVVNLFKKQRTDKPTLIAFGLALLLFSLDFLPSGVWAKQWHNVTHYPMLHRKRAKSSDRQVMTLSIRRSVKLSSSGCSITAETSRLHSPTQQSKRLTSPDFDI